MENRHISDAAAADDDDESEQFSERFLCCVCLDLLYKPIVLSCGHIACFWCVHRSMSGEQKSHCPLCRHSYHHFPTICQLLHCLLLKLYPLAYKRRESQILEQEEKTGFFSPQLDVQAWTLQVNQESNVGDSVSQELTASLENTVSNSCTQSNGTVISMPTDGGDNEGKGNATDGGDGGSSNRISVADVPCAACKELLFRPVVLNCGHVYCESCIVNQDDEKLRCQVCQYFHPTGFPKVCLDLQKFLIEQFPKELAHRRDDVQLKHVNSTACESKSKSSREAERSSSWSCHAGVGCDYCGMYPIIGDRYQCKDCVEKIGFDLCSDCYNTNSKLPGRFNQQHTAEHQFEHISSNIFRGRVRMLSDRLDGSFAVLLAHMSGIAEESERNRDLSNATSTNSENDEDDEDVSLSSFIDG